MLNKKRSSLTGFTLIELIVVVIIIGILASLSTAFFNKTVDEAQKKQAKAMLNLIRSAEGIYWNREKSLYPINPLNDTVRSVLMINVYNNEDWTYTLPSGSSIITATRERGSNEDSIITIDIDTGVISSY